MGKKEEQACYQTGIRNVTLSPNFNLGPDHSGSPSDAELKAFLKESLPISPSSYSLAYPTGCHSCIVAVPRARQCSQIVTPRKTRLRS